MRNHYSSWPTCTDDKASSIAVLVDKHSDISEQILPQRKTQLNGIQWTSIKTNSCVSQHTGNQEASFPWVWALRVSIPWPMVSTRHGPERWFESAVRSARDCADTWWQPPEPSDRRCSCQPPHFLWDYQWRWSEEISILKVRYYCCASIEIRMPLVGHQSLLKTTNNNIQTHTKRRTKGEHRKPSIKVSLKKSEHNSECSKCD